MTGPYRPNATSSQLPKRLDDVYKVLRLPPMPPHTRVVLRQFLLLRMSHPRLAQSWMVCSARQRLQLLPFLQDSRTLTLAPRLLPTGGGGPGACAAATLWSVASDRTVDTDVLQGMIVVTRR